MHRIIEKGADVTSIEHPSQTPRIWLGVAAVMTIIVIALLFVSPAFAEGAPEFSHEDEVVNLDYSTRVTIGVFLITTKETTEWRAEYAPAEPNGEAPAEGSPVWKIVNKEQVSPSSHGTLIFIGTGHLSPATSYYARFFAENKAGKAVETVPFETLPLDKPEVAPAYRRGFNSEPLPEFQGGPVNATSAVFTFVVESNGSETTYHIEYSLPENGHAPSPAGASWKHFTSNASGTITPAEEYGYDRASVTGLSPETTYYIRVKASNDQGEITQNTYDYGGEERSTFTTPTARPGNTEAPETRNVTATSTYLTTTVVPNGFKTVWQFESAPSESGPWTPVPGGTGTISQAQASATPYEDGEIDGARFAGLKASTVYYVRTVAENECEAGKVGCGKTIGRVGHFETSGAPSASAFSVHGLHGESLRLLGSVNPNSQPTSAEQLITLEETPMGGSFVLTFEGQSTAAIAYDASGETVARALESLSTIAGDGQTAVIGAAGGPYTVYFGGPNAGKAEPLIEASGLGLTPPGTVSVVSTQQGGEAYGTHYHFDYVSAKSFAESGWAGAQTTGEVDAGSGTSLDYVGSDLPSLTPGETYRYRLVASNTAPGTSAVDSAEQSLTVPTPVTPSGGEAGSCPNEAFRTGLSAHLPDCRAYELLTPVDKEGAQEFLHYGGGLVANVVVSEDGEHVIAENDGVHWGGAGNSPYLFSRLEGDGWLMTYGSPQPETGPYVTNPELYNTDTTQIAFSSQYGTATNVQSANIEYKLGPIGGPYKTITSVPRQYQEGGPTGWVAADGDFSKLVFSTEDSSLPGEEATPTKHGDDLYEYTAGGGLRQLNVDSEQVTIGTCGARMADGHQGSNQYSGPHSVSASGSRVFFEAVPGKDCSEALNLYLRTNGETTVDIGAYTFAGANEQGSEVLLEKGDEFFLYDTEAGTIKHLFDFAGTEHLDVVSENLSDIYLNASGSLYRYDVPSETLSFITTGTGEALGETSSDGRYYYYDGSAAGLPGGGVMRYDSAENVIECASCASTFDPEPKTSLLNGTSGIPEPNGGVLKYSAVSSNGDFAFFTTPAALVPQDADGEIEIETKNKDSETFDIGSSTSPSSDIYEWRKDGVDGCAQLQGCLALITDGRGGFYNHLLGTADEGRDVFIYTFSKLLPQDQDTAGDIYDARIDGGFAPPPPRPVECEGDACSTPPAPPNDPTPSSLTLTGAGNLAPAALATPKATKPKPKKKGNAKKKAGEKRKDGKASKKTSRAGHDRGGNR